MQLQAWRKKNHFLRCSFFLSSSSFLSFVVYFPLAVRDRRAFGPSKRARAANFLSSQVAKLRKKVQRSTARPIAVETFCRHEEMGLVRCCHLASLSAKESWSLPAQQQQQQQLPIERNSGVLPPTAFARLKALPGCRNGEKIWLFSGENPPFHTWSPVVCMPALLIIPRTPPTPPTATFSLSFSLSHSLYPVLSFLLSPGSCSSFSPKRLQF